MEQQASTENNGNQEFVVPEGAVVLPQEFVARIKGKLGDQDFELEFLRGQVAALEAHVQELSAVNKALSSKLEEEEPTTAE